MIGQVLDLWMQEAAEIASLLERQPARLTSHLHSKLTSTHLNDPMNTINLISAYRTPSDRNLWCFDDARFGLSQELLMHEASAFITAMVGEECERAELIFSTVHFPRANCILSRTWSGEKVKEGGCEYLAHSPILKDANDPNQKVIEVEDVWLCPAMMHYFGGEVAPEFIYGQITPSKSTR